MFAMAIFFKSKAQKPQTTTEQIWQIAKILFIVFMIRTFVFGLYQVPTGSMETTMLVGERFFADKFTYLFSKPQRRHIISLNSPLFKYSPHTMQRLFEEYVWGPQNLTKRVIGIPGDTIEGKVEEGKPVIYLNGQKIDEPYLNTYPLIAVYSSNPARLANQAKDEAVALISQGKMSRAQFEEYINNKVGREIHNKTYDPSMPFNQQPFYRIDESLVFKTDGKPHITQPNTLINEPKAGNEAPHDHNYFDGTDVFHIKLGDNQYWIMGDNRLNSGDSRMFGPIDGRLIHGRILFRIMSIDSNDDWQILDLLKHPIDFWTRVRWNRFFQWMG
jgi:signal peptidase I